jgi:hypothetical protein
MRLTGNWIYCRHCEGQPAVGAITQVTIEIRGERGGDGRGEPDDEGRDARKGSGGGGVGGGSGDGKGKSRAAT